MTQSFGSLCSGATYDDKLKAIFTSYDVQTAGGAVCHFHTTEKTLSHVIFSGRGCCMSLLYLIGHTDSHLYAEGMQGNCATKYEEDENFRFNLRKHFQYDMRRFNWFE